MEGTVKFFNRKKGFGFISGDDGKDYFVHFSGLTEGTFLRDNDKVSFEAIEGDKGLKAEQVVLLQKGSERDDIVTEEEPAAEEASTEEEPAAEEASTEEEPAAEEASTEEEPAAEEEPAEETSVEEEKQEE